MGVPIIRAIVYWGLYCGPPALGNYHIVAMSILDSAQVARVPTAGRVNGDSAVALPIKQKLGPSAESNLDLYRGRGFSVPVQIDAQP